MRSIKFALAAIAATIMTVPAMAGPGQWSTKIVYYSDATKTVQVGQEWDTCPTIEHESETIVQGIQTEHYNVYSGNCP